MLLSPQIASILATVTTLYVGPVSKPCSGQWRQLIDIYRLPVIPKHPSNFPPGQTSKVHEDTTGLIIPAFCQIFDVPSNLWNSIRDEALLLDYNPSKDGNSRAFHFYHNGPHCAEIQWDPCRTYDPYLWALPPVLGESWVMDLPLNHWLRAVLRYSLSTLRARENEQGACSFCYKVIWMGRCLSSFSNMISSRLLG